MAENMTLKARPALGSYGQEFGAMHLTELEDIGMVSLAVPLGGEKALNKMLKAEYDFTLPAEGRSVIREGTRLIRLSPDQAMLVFACPAPDALARVRARLGGTAWMTDQSDAWVTVRLAGEGVREALARVIMLDLDAAIFPLNSAARTLMEHLGVVIVAEASDSFLLLSARSSAGSFLHALEASIDNVS